MYDALCIKYLRTKSTARKWNEGAILYLDSGAITNFSRGMMQVHCFSREILRKWIWISAVSDEILRKF